jgi:hypothetical protein
MIKVMLSPCLTVSTATRLRAVPSDDRGSVPGEVGNFFFDTMSRPVLGPTQPPIQWVLGAISLGVKRPRREADHSPPFSAEVKE